MQVFFGIRCRSVAKLIVPQGWRAPAGAKEYSPCAQAMGTPQKTIQAPSGRKNSPQPIVLNVKPRREDLSATDSADTTDKDSSLVPKQELGHEGPGREGAISIRAIRAIRGWCFSTGLLLPRTPAPPNATAASPPDSRPRGSTPPTTTRPATGRP